MKFYWGDRPRPRWAKLCAEILGGESYANTLTALLNLDWRHSTSEKSIPQVDLTHGWNERVLPLLLKVRPGIVCALTNRVWDIVEPWAQRRSVVLPRCPVPLAREPIGFTIDGCEFPTFLVKSHNHPSRGLSNEHIVDLGRACQWLLNEVA